MCFRPFCRNGVAGGMLSQALLRCISQRIRIGRGTQKLYKGTGEGQVFLDWESLTGNRKPASDRTHWIANLRHARPGAGRALVGNGETGRVQSQRIQPVTGTATGRRIGGYDYKTEAIQRPRADNHTRFREIRNSNFLVPPPLGVGVFGKLPAARKQKDRQRIGSADPSRLPPPRNRKPAGDLARQIQPLPSRSRRHLDYESSGSPRLSRSYR